MTMRDTVFSPSFGNRPERLVGREKVLEDFSESLDSRPGSKERATVLLGQRGSGKTVLLWEMADRASSRGFVVAKPTIASAGMLERIVEKVQDDGERHVKGRGARLVGGSVGALGFSAGLQFSREVQESRSFSYKLTHLVRELTAQGKGTLILVDELQANSPEIRQLVITYQELVGEQLNVALVMAGLPGAVAATLNDRILTFLNRAKKVTLGPLALADVDAFYKKAFSEVGLVMDGKTRRKAAEATQGSPYLLQLIGHYLVAYASDDGSLGGDGFAEALAVAQRDFENDVCKTSLVSLSDKDVAFLEAMACDADSSTMADIALRMCVTPDYAQKYRKRLIDAGIIEQSGRGKVAFAVPYLKSYLQREDCC